MLSVLLLITAITSLSLAQNYEGCVAGASGIGKEYRGNVAVSESGYTCLKWATTAYFPTRYPSAGLADGDGNSCRNPIPKEFNYAISEPWCYVPSYQNDAGHTRIYETCGLMCPQVTLDPVTTGASTGSEHSISCVVKSLKSEVSDIKWTTDEGAANYRIENEYTEKTGLQVSTLTLTSSDVVALKQAGLAEHKFTCTFNVPGYDNTLSAVQSVTIDTSISYRYPGNCVTGDGVDYRGDVAMTKTGQQCVDWTKWSKTGNYPGNGLEGNYCRNPDGEPGPWCFVRKWYDEQNHLRNVNSVPFELCDIRLCASVKMTHAGETLTKDEPISCVVEGIFEQVSGIEWTIATTTSNSYSPEDGVYGDGKQTSTLHLTRKQRIALKEAGGDQHSFTCKVKVPDFDDPITASKTLTISIPAEDEPSEDDATEDDAAEDDATEDDAAEDDAAEDDAAEDDAAEDDAAEDEAQDGSHDCEKTFSCSAARAKTEVGWLLITLVVLICFGSQRT